MTISTLIIVLPRLEARASRMSISVMDTASVCSPWVATRAPVALCLSWELSYLLVNRDLKDFTYSDKTKSRSGFIAIQVLAKRPIHFFDWITGQS